MFLVHFRGLAGLRRASAPVEIMTPFSKFRAPHRYSDHYSTYFKTFFGDTQAAGWWGQKHPILQKLVENGIPGHNGRQN